MTRSPHTVTVDTPLLKAQEIFREREIRHLPVLEGKNLSASCLMGISSRLSLHREARDLLSQMR